MRMDGVLTLDSLASPSQVGRSCYHLGQPCYAQITISATAQNKHMHTQR